MKQCPRCNTQVNDQFNFCNMCGFQFLQQPLMQQPSILLQQPIQQPPVQTQQPLQPPRQYIPPSPPQQPIYSQQYYQQPPKKSNTPILIGIMVAVIAIVIIVLIAFMSDVFNDSEESGSDSDSDSDINLETPKGAIACTGADAENYTVTVIEMNPPVEITNISWYLQDQNGKTVRNYYGGVEEIYGMVEGNITFYDNDRDEKVSPNDIFTVSKILPDGMEIPNGYQLLLRFEPTGDSIASAEMKG